MSVILIVIYQFWMLSFSNGGQEKFSSASILSVGPCLHRRWNIKLPVITCFSLMARQYNPARNCRSGLAQTNTITWTHWGVRQRMILQHIRWHCASLPYCSWLSGLLRDKQYSDVRQWLKTGIWTFQRMRNWNKGCGEGQSYSNVKRYIQYTPLLPPDTTRLWSVRLDRRFATPNDPE